MPDKEEKKDETRRGLMLSEMEGLKPASIAGRGTASSYYYNEIGFGFEPDDDSEEEEYYDYPPPAPTKSIASTDSEENLPSEYFKSQDKDETLRWASGEDSAVVADNRKPVFDSGRLTDIMAATIDDNNEETLAQNDNPGNDESNAITIVDIKSDLKNDETKILDISEMPIRPRPDDRVTTAEKNRPDIDELFSGGITEIKTPGLDMTDADMNRTEIITQPSNISSEKEADILKENTQYIENIFTGAPADSVALDLGNLLPPERNEVEHDPFSDLPPDIGFGVGDVMPDSLKARSGALDYGQELSGGDDFTDILANISSSEKAKGDYNPTDLPSENFIARDYASAPQYPSQIEDGQNDLLSAADGFEEDEELILDPNAPMPEAEVSDWQPPSISTFDSDFESEELSLPDMDFSATISAHDFENDYGDLLADDEPDAILSVGTDDTAPTRNSDWNDAGGGMPPEPETKSRSAGSELPGADILHDAFHIDSDDGMMMEDNDDAMELPENLGTIPRPLPTESQLLESAIIGESLQGESNLGDILRSAAESGNQEPPSEAEFTQAPLPSESQMAAAAVGENLDGEEGIEDLLNSPAFTNSPDTVDESELEDAPLPADTLQAILGDLPDDEEDMNPASIMPEETPGSISGDGELNGMDTVAILAAGLEADKGNTAEAMAIAQEGINKRGPLPLAPESGVDDIFGGEPGVPLTQDLDNIFDSEGTQADEPDQEMEQAIDDQLLGQSIDDFMASIDGNETPSSSTSTVEKKTRPSIKQVIVGGSYAIYKKLDKKLDFKHNWGVYLDIISAIVSTASLAAIAARFGLFG